MRYVVLLLVFITLGGIGSARAQERVIDINAPGEVVVSELVDLSVDGDFSAVWWDVGIGEQVQGKEIQVAYDTPGMYMVTVMAVDDEAVLVDTHELAVVTTTEITQAVALQLSEIMANPIGSDDAEWIELYNPSSYPVSLQGVSITDKSGKSYSFSDSIVPPYSYHVVLRSEFALSLNNNAETIQLHDASRNLMDVVEYAHAQEGVTYSYTSGGWDWSAPTPGQANRPPESTQTAAGSLPVILNEPEIHTLQQMPVLPEQLVDEVIAVDVDDEVLPVAGIFISELLPSPSGDDRLYEYIELYNPTSERVDLSGWSLADNAREFVVEEYIILPGEYALFERQDTRLALNNTGDHVYLYDQYDRLIDSVEYGKAESDVAYTRVDNKWFWSNDLTPGEVGVVTSARRDETASFAESITDISLVPAISELNQYEKGDAVTVQGIVTAVPYELGKQIVYIQDSTGGIQLFLSSAMWPNLSYGDVIEVSGTMSSYYGEQRITLYDSESVMLVATDGPAVSKNITSIAQLYEHVGELVDMQGVPLEVAAKYMQLGMDSDKDSVRIQIYTDAFVLSDLQLDGIISVTGIVRIRDDVIRVYPRNSDDIRQVPSPAEFTEQQVDLSLPSTIKSPSSVSKTWIGLYSILGIVIGWLGTMIYMYKKLNY